MPRLLSAWLRQGAYAATAWSLAIVCLATLGVGESAGALNGESTDGHAETYSSLAAFRGASVSASAVQPGTTDTSVHAHQMRSTMDGARDLRAAAAAAPMALASAAEMTTAPPDEVTTTPPPPPETPSSILLGIQAAVTKQLYRSHHQWVNALLAFIFGTVMVFDGEHFFKWLIVALAFLLTAVLAMSDVSQLWSLDDESKIRHLVGLEVGALGAYAAWLGIEGVMIVIGAIVGCFFAFSAQGKLVDWGVTALSHNKLIIVLFYSLFTVGAIVIFKRKKHVRGVAVLSAAVGGALVASAISWFITDLAVLGYLDSLCSAFPGLKPVGGAWVDFLCLLWSSSAEDKGWFANSSYNFEISGQTCRLDRVISCSLWLALFVAGAVVQLRALARVAQARSPSVEPLREELLPVKR